MRLARTFSTALRRCRQALYEPYIEPLNKEKKKALRKVIMGDLPDLNKRLPRDVQITLRDYQPDSTLRRQRKATFDAVESLIQSTYGHQFALIDMSLGQYARDLNIAPLEFAIYDKSQHQGLPPGSESAPLSGPYDHNALANLLLGRGFSGHFIDGDAMRITRRHTADEYRIEDLGNLPEYPGWPDYTRFPVTYLSYPPILHVEENRPLLPFTLSPVMPLYTPLLKLLREYLCDQLCQDFVSAIYLWFRSIELHHMSTLSIALLTIHIVQAELRVPSLQTVGPNNEGMDELKNNYDGAWIRAELPPSYPTRLIWIETAHRKFASQSWEYKKIKRLLFSFFDTFSTHSQTKPFLSSLKVISIRDAQYLDRKEPILSRVDRWTPFENKVDAIRVGVTPWNPMNQPPEWVSQPLVIVDPFLPSFNHARNLSPHHAAYFSRFCSVSRRAMAAGHRYSDLLGAGLRPAGESLSLSSASYRMTERGRETGEFGLRSYSTSAVDGEILRSISTFGEEASKIYKEMLPPEPVLQARKETIERVKYVIKDNFGKDLGVHAFGSTEYGVSTAASDLDLIVIDPVRPDGFTKKFMKEKRQPRVYNVTWVGQALHKRGFQKVISIPTATVPIVKFHDPKTGLDCDININDRLGLLNTNLIKAYCDLQPDLVRPMIMTIKRWAKAHDLNDPSGMRGGPVSFSSYTLAIMVIGFLQCQGVLPNLQAGFLPLPKKTVEGVFWIRTKRRKKKDYSPRERCDVRWKLPLASWRPAISMTLGQAIHGWFKFWGSDFDYDAYALSIRDSGVILRDMKTLWKRKFGVKVTKKKKKKEKAPTVDPSMVEKLAGEISKLRTSPVISTEIQRLEDDVARREDIEDAAVAALHEMDMELQEGDEGEEREEDSIMDGPEKLQVIDIAAEEAALSQAEGLVMEGALPPPKAIITGEAAQALVPPLADAGSEIDETESDVESVSLHLVAPDQPPEWADHYLVVADPFIKTKNLGGTIGQKQVSRFKMKCKAAMVAIEDGESLSEIFPEEEEDPLLDDDEIIFQGKGRGVLGEVRGRGRGRGVVHIGGRDKPKHGRKQREPKSEAGPEKEYDANVNATEGGPSKPKRRRTKKSKTGPEALQDGTSLVMAYHQSSPAA